MNSPRRKARASRSTFRPRLDRLEARELLTAITVTTLADSGAGSLRAAVGSAVSGDSINFAPAVRGTITLTTGPVQIYGKNLAIAGPGASGLAVSGGGASGVFDIGADPSGPGASAVSIAGLTIANGNAPGGAGVSLAGASLTVTDSVFRGNTSLYAGGAIANLYSPFATTVTVVRDQFVNNTVGTAGADIGYRAGGAIALAIPTSVVDSTFAGNRVSGTVANGGAIYASRSLSVTGSTFTGNTAHGLSTGYGGAISVDPAATTLTVGSSRFGGNIAEGVTGDNAPSEGGAIYSFAQQSSTVTGSLFTGNVVRGLTPGPFGAGGVAGGALSIGGGTFVLSGSTLAGNQALGGSRTVAGRGEAGMGGAINVTSRVVTMSSSAFLGNLARGGDGPAGTLAAGGAINFAFNANAAGAPASTISDSVFAGNRAITGTADASLNSLAFGGALAFAYNNTTLTISNTTVTGNQALGGGVRTPGATGGPAQGGGIYAAYTGPLTIRNSTILGNEVVGGSGTIGGPAQGGGLYIATPTTLIDTLILANVACGGTGTTTPGQGVGGGLFIDPNTGSVTLKGRTKIIGNRASGADNDTHGTPALA